ncbi:phosphate/phosphite/phosphonate ABC transporter substrate-binding protein [Oceaniglobus roseus]|uniref:phosphate/phosphite/phosphonate ABC transporter substrate-binding protein n=1 Tax=Oceaniglobus roseus TaxID=1737570 RepID=UPI000C7F0DA2|nr:PhnD/SsuA/transferrin family substrate-binding protein [Kandeliimicrobium roseum]
MIASLPMYDRPETAAAHDALWAGIREGLRARGGQAPDGLTRSDDLWAVWEDPGLVLGQTCGLPFRSRLHDRVTLVGAPDLRLPDAAPGHYYSVFVIRRGDSGDLADYAARRFAFNQGHSHSGWAAPQTVAARQGFRFTQGVETGAHAQSARAVAEGRADIAAIDAHTWRALTAFDGDMVQRLEVIGRTDTTPAPPYIAARGADADLLAEVLERAFDGLAAAHADRLGIGGVVRVPKAAYMAVPTPP